MSAAKRQRELNRAKKEHENAKLSAQIATGNVVFTNIAESVMAKLIERQAAQIEMMRDFIETAPVSTGVCCCGESMEGHSSPMNCGHTPVDLWDHSVISVLSTTPDQALEQFAAKVREQCAGMCQSVIASGAYDGNQQYAAASCRDAIRAIKELP